MHPAHQDAQCRRRLDRCVSATLLKRKHWLDCSRQAGLRSGGRGVAVERPRKSMWGCGPRTGALGFNGRQRAVAVGMALAGKRSGLGELLEVDFEAMSLMRLYRVRMR